MCKSVVRCFGVFFHLWSGRMLMWKYVPGLTPATAASWRKHLSQLRSRMVLAWLLFLLQPTLPYNIKPRVQKFLQVSSGWLYGYGSFVFVYFAAIIYTYNQRHSAYGTMLFVLAATFAVPFLESRPSANAWLRKFLVYNATVPVYLCAGLCKIRYLGLKAIFSGSWITHGVMDRTHGYSCIPWANKWLVSQPAVLGFPEPWTCMFLSYFTMFFEILAPVGCIALTQPGKTPSFVWKLWLMYLVFCIEFHVQVFFQFGPNWAEQTILVLFACDPLKPLQPLFGKLGGKNSELPQVFVDAEHLGPCVASLGDRLRAVLGFGMLLGWLFVQLWSDVDHLFLGYPWEKNHDPYLPIPEMDMFTPASKESCYKASFCCVIVLMVLFGRKMSWDMMILKSQRPKHMEQD